MTDDENLRLMVNVNSSFSPSAPINSKDLFAGRKPQISSVLGAIMQRGQHAVIFGERGVGKTSLSNIIFDLLVLAGKTNFQVARYNCGVSADFGSLWRSVFKQLTISNKDETVSLDEFLEECPGSENVREVFQRGESASIVIVDEFDRIVESDTTALMADTIKSLSDHSINTTLILVGVADSVDQLIAEHRSIERALVQVKMPRMDGPELIEIIDKGLSNCNMTIDSEVKSQIARLSRGLPYCTHLLTMHAALSALFSNRTAITWDDFNAAVSKAVENQQQTIVNAYELATHSPRKNIFKEVLLACALAPTNELGYFKPVSLRRAMHVITGKPYDVPQYSRHLKQFCSEERGPVLQERGQSKRYRFRFANPLMEPFILIKALSEKMITANQISEVFST